MPIAAEMVTAPELNAGGGSGNYKSPWSEIRRAGFFPANVGEYFA